MIIVVVVTQKMEVCSLLFKEVSRHLLVVR